MKTYCKHTRVADPRFVRESIDHYLRGKRSRRDVGAWLDHHPDLDRVAEAIASEIRTGRFHDTTIRYFNRVEPISGKHRVIGRESVHHQILDHVAIDAMPRSADGRPPASRGAAPSTRARPSNDGPANAPANGS